MILIFPENKCHRPTFFNCCRW